MAFSEFLTTKKFKDTPTGKKIQLANKLRDFLKSEHKSWRDKLAKLKLRIAALPDPNFAANFYREQGNHRPLAESHPASDDEQTPFETDQRLQSTDGVFRLIAQTLTGMSAVKGRSLHEIKEWAMAKDALNIKELPYL